MAAQTDTTIYDKVVLITHSYLGPAANRFIARQVENHLHKRPGNLSPEDLLSLTDWIRVAVSLLTEDSELIDEYIAELRKLAHSYEKPVKKSSKRTPRNA